jgi:hypothetical protein
MSWWTRESAIRACRGSGLKAVPPELPVVGDPGPQAPTPRRRRALQSSEGVARVVRRAIVGLLIRDPGAVAQATAAVGGSSE